MWLITYNAIPKPNTPEFNKSGGAYVNCWILFAWQDGAEVLARHEVEKEWVILEKVETSWYDPGDIKETDEEWEYYEQATIDGGCFVFHHYPRESEEPDEDFEMENSTTMDSRPPRTEH